ncbi:MAG: hypothetical protein P0S96_05555 [Simkaniaceae bacterium]|nr:hypothetical protein [Candidatus Sacchlamyda saccharinae]
MNWFGYRTENLEKPPHLILHFDVNETLIAIDKAGQKTAHDVVSTSIANRVKAVWDESISQPISYSDYIRHHKLENRTASSVVKKEQDALISKVLTVLEAQDHPDLEEMQDLYAKAMHTLENQKTLIFPSFYALIDRLNEHDLKYTIAIRTFGTDIPIIVDELNQECGEGFISKKDVNGHEELYEILKEGHVAIQDDFHHWFNHDKNWQYGKAFPVEQDESKAISFFFDDNAKFSSSHPEENIVCPFDAESKKLIHPKEVIEKKRLIPVDTLLALSDEDYYVNIVQEALDKAVL